MDIWKSKIVYMSFIWNIDENILPILIFIWKLDKNIADIEIMSLNNDYAVNK